MKLRLLLTEECNRRCRGCCNKDFNLKELPICNDFSGYELIMLTGGEPMLNPMQTELTARLIRSFVNSPIYLYTAKCDNVWQFLNILQFVDGVTLTLHTRKDAVLFSELNKVLSRYDLKSKSMRLNVFNGVSTKGVNLVNWKVKRNIKWIKNCPLPEDEVFMRV